MAADLKGTFTLWASRRRPKWVCSGRPVRQSHSLRATAETLLLDTGVDLDKVQELLGHRHVTTTQIDDERRWHASEGASHDVPIRSHFPIVTGFSASLLEPMGSAIGKCRKALCRLSSPRVGRKGLNLVRAVDLESVGRSVNRKSHSRRIAQLRNATATPCSGESRSKALLGRTTSFVVESTLKLWRCGNDHDDRNHL